MALKRREFIQSGAAGLSALALSGMKLPAESKRSSFPVPHIRSSKIAQKVIILGIDGMDPKLLARMIAQGEMPYFKKLAEQGHFGPLQTTMPPQSPVAWSSFITGTNPGGHGIYDFIHRDPVSFAPYLSTSRSYAAGDKLSLGKWNIPLGSGRVELMRRGRSFWSVLSEHDIPSTIYSIPANFPVEQGKNVRGLSGMGTPDLLGGYGVYTYLTDTEVPNAHEFTGGRIIKVVPENNAIAAKIKGPKNPFRNDGSSAEIEITVHRDPWEPTLKIDIQGQTLILKQGEWSEWTPLKFEFLSLFATVSGMVRFYAKEVHPNFKLYVTPVNIDPANPSMPICSPAEYSRELSQAVGRFYTQGLPADTKALSEGTLTSYEFLQQAKLVLAENLRSFEYEFDRFSEGCFMYYFSSIDQNCHMLMRCMDPSHPLYEPDAPQEVKDAIRFYYRTMDSVLGRVFSKVDNYTTVLVLSDHGFVPFTREFNLSTWLYEQGYTAINYPDKLDEIDFFRYVNWNQTKAYALGINGLYLNLSGREKRGSLAPDQAEGVKRELIAKLMQVRDPLNGKQIIRQVYDRNEIYSGPFVELAPDLLVGYEAGYRISDESILGKFPREIVRNRTNKWSSDHCMDPNVVPGILLSNRSCAKSTPGIWDMAPSILERFGLTAPSSMTGTSIFKT